MTNIREAHTFGDLSGSRVACLRSDKVQCLTYKTQILRRMIWISALDVGVLMDKCREERIGFQVNEPLALSQEDERVFSRGQSPMCWSSPKIRIRYQIGCLLQRGYRVDGAFLPECNGSGPSPPALRPPDNSSIGCADGGSATGALELPPLYLRASCG